MDILGLFSFDGKYFINNCNFIIYSAIQNLLTSAVYLWIAFLTVLFRPFKIKNHI